MADSGRVSAGQAVSLRASATAPVAAVPLVPLIPVIPLVALEHVYAARGEETVLHDVSLRIDPGEHVVLLGPNGCGKSTLLKVMTCELYPLVRSPSKDGLGEDAPETRVQMFGRERWDTAELRRRMGVVSAELPGKPILTTSAFDAVLTGFFSSSTLWPNLLVTPAMRERAEAILRLVGVEKLHDRTVGTMSAGQQRRVMIGRAMAGATGDGLGAVQMLLLDEPSNALDLAAQYDLRIMLREIAQAGTTILLVTHQVSDILPEMGRVLMMREGRIVADGAKRDVLTTARMSELFGRTVSIEERNQRWFARA